MFEAVVMASCFSCIQAMSAFGRLVLFISVLLLCVRMASTSIEASTTILWPSASIMFVVSVWLRSILNSCMLVLRRREMRGRYCFICFLLFSSVFIFAFYVVMLDFPFYCFTVWKPLCSISSFSLCLFLALSCLFLFVKWYLSKCFVFCGPYRFLFRFQFPLYLRSLLLIGCFCYVCVLYM